MFTQTRRTLIALALLLYATSLVLPAFRCNSGKSFDGFLVLGLGWISISSLDPRWLANVGFAVLVVSSFGKSTRFHPGTIGVTSILALCSFAPSLGCAGGAGSVDTTLGLAMGGYLWVAALLIACLANALASRQNEEPGYTAERLRE